LKKGNQSALQAFWEQVFAQGTPLVEQVGEKEYFVTLLWCDPTDWEPGELTCALGGILNSSRMAHPLFHLDGSDIWYRTYRLPSQVRATYHFFLNGEPVSDYLSPLALFVPADPVSVYGGKEMQLAIVELPDAAPDHWNVRRSGIPQGNLQTQSFTSAIAGHDYSLSIYTPPDYRSDGGPYPLLLFFDEWTYTHVIPLAKILDNLIADGAIPPLVAALFGHMRREDRMREMGFYEPFFACVGQELLPWLRGHYAVSCDPAQTTVAGASMGGIAAMYSGLRYPEIFGNIYSHTGSFQAGPSTERAYHRLEQALRQRPMTAQRFYLDVGMLERDEMGFGSPDGGPNALKSNMMMRAVLRELGYEVHYDEYPGGHDLLWGAAPVADALKVLIGKH
jgi:enterochelin esterase family protein